MKKVIKGSSDIFFPPATHHDVFRVDKLFLKAR